METTNRDQAIEFINAWRHQPSKHRFMFHVNSAMESMKVCISLTRRDCPNTRQGYEEALLTLQYALDKY